MSMAAAVWRRTMCSSVMDRGRGMVMRTVHSMVGRGAAAAASTRPAVFNAESALGRMRVEQRLQGRIRTIIPREAARFFARPPQQDQGSGGGRGGRGEEPSVIVTNVAKGEKLKMKDMWAIKDKPALYIKEDGSKQETTVQQVLDEAFKLNLDPVLVSGINGGDMLVLKLLDVGRTRHDLQKKKRDSAKKNTGSQNLKELRFGLNIDQNDLNTKMKQAKNFLEKGHRVKIFMQLKGADFHRSQSQALARLDEIAAMVGDAGTQDGKPVISGNVVSTALVPKPTASGNSGKKDTQKQQLSVPVSDDPCSPEDVAKQAAKVRALKEASKQDPATVSKAELEKEIELLMTLKTQLDKQET